MATNPSFLEWSLSGGAANADVNLSLGGAKSSVDVTGLTVVEGTPITGVTITVAGGIIPGNVDLVFTQATNTFTLNGGTGVVVAADGDYFIPDDTTNGGGYVSITVVFASLPGSDVTNTLTVSAALNNLFDDILSAEVLAGRTEYRCVYLENTDPADDFLTLDFEIVTQPNGVDSIEIGVDPAGTGTAVVIATEDAVPAGVTFGTGAINVAGGLASGDTSALWIKRIVPAGSGPLVPVDLSTIKATVTYVQ